jgi:DNA ligase-1
MRAFAALTERLAFESGRAAKLTLIADYLATAPDPDRGYALAALAGTLDFPAAKPAILRGLIEARLDPELFRLSYDYVGDLAETIALAWPRQTAAPAPDLGLAEVVDTLARASRRETPAIIERWLDRLDEPERFALLKLMTGGLRIGVSFGLARQALARLGTVPAEEIEEVWHGARPPYAELFAWIEGRAGRPEAAGAPLFRSPMLAQPLEPRDLDALDPADFAAEWKWDGIRVQAVGGAGDANLGRRRLYSRTGDDIGAGFPDLVAALDFDATLDGELVVLEAGAAATFSRLQQRLNRKAPTLAQMTENPAGLVAYDLLFERGVDVRPLPFAERRRRLESFVAALANPRILLSPRVDFASWDELAAARAASHTHAGIEGVMLKRLDSSYVAGRPRGPWFKWKRDPDRVDCVLMYAQRGHGKRSSYYSDYTFGVWHEDEAGRRLVPVGKAYFGFTDAELLEIDRFVRLNTVNRFGPVREVVHEPGKGLVFEVAHEGLQRSTRHKSGIAMRFPRIARLRWDKPPAEADTLERLMRDLAEAEGRGVAAPALGIARS